MSGTDSKCPACAVRILAPDPIARVYEGRVWHTACLIRSLEADRATASELYERLHPHVRDRSVLRGLCRFAEAALDHPAMSHDLKRNEDCHNAMAWLSQAAGWSWP